MLKGKSRFDLIGFFLPLVYLVSGCSSSPRPDHPVTDAVRVVPVIIGHRGACGYRPEETLASYELAIQMGADFIEPDLVSTQDGVLIARHENELSGTTDAAERFPEKKARKLVDGKEIAGWFAEDFTLAEIKELRAKERLAFRDHSFDGKFPIATFREILELARRRGRETHRVIGVYPETKHPSYFRGIGLPLEQRLVDELKSVGWVRRDSPVIIQSMEPSSLKLLRKLTAVRLMQLTDAASETPYDFILSHDPRNYGDLVTPRGLREIATYADGIGPWKRQIVPMKAPVDQEDGPNGLLLPPTTFVRDAHEAGLFVHPYTFRRETEYLAGEYEGDPVREYLQFFDLGVDGVFTDNADLAFKARKIWLRRSR